MSVKHPPVANLQNTGHSWLERAEQPLPQSHQEFPKRKYHKSGTSTVVETPEQEKALGADFADTPAAFDEKAQADKAAADKAAADAKNAADGKALWEKQQAEKAAAAKTAADQKK